MKNLIVGFLLGAVATAVAVLLLGQRSSTAPAGSGTPAAPALRTPPPVSVSAGAPRLMPDQAESAETFMPSTHKSAQAGIAVHEQEAPVRAAEIPGATPRDALPPPLASNRLTDAFRVDCLYGPGYGGRWVNGEPATHTAAWQGGEITFDTIDLESGTAMLRGGSGVTRTSNGELEVRVQATHVGLHFTVFVAGGELIVATVYGAHDTRRRHAAVVSFHGTHLGNGSAQFHGSCTAN